MRFSSQNILKITMKNTLKKFIPLVALPSFIVLASSCDSTTPLGEQNNVLGNAEFTIPEVLASGDVVNMKSFVLTRPLDLTFSIESGSTLSYFDSRFPEGVAPYDGVFYRYTSADTTRTMSFTIYNSNWDTTDDNGTNADNNPDGLDPVTSDDFNVLERILEEAIADDTNISTLAAIYADSGTKENAQALMEALSLNQDLRDIKMVFDRQGTQVRVFRSLTATLQVDGSSLLTRVGVPLTASLSGQLTRGADDSVNFPTGFTFTAAGDAVSE